MILLAGASRTREREPGGCYADAMKDLSWNQQDKMAETFHEAYEDEAPRFNYETRIASRKPWAEVPEDNRMLMRQVMHRLFCVNDEGYIVLRMPRQFE